MSYLGFSYMVVITVFSSFGLFSRFLSIESSPDI